MSARRLAISDRDWVERVRQGDHAAFETVFRAYYAELCAFAYRYLQSPTLAEEVVHDVFAQIWQTRERLQVRDNVRAFLYGCVRHRAISLLRRQTLEHGWLARAAAEQRVAPTHSWNQGVADMEREQLVAAIEQALAVLPERCRTAVALRWQREMSYAEIAETMEISVKTVEAHMTRAIKALRAHLPALIPHITED